MYTPSKENVAPFDYENEPMCCAKMNVYVSESACIHKKWHGL